MPVLLRVRKIQLQRELKEAGFHAVVLYGLLAYLIYRTFAIYADTLYAFGLIGLLFLCCLFLQSYRNDKLFVYKHINRPRFEIYLEYFAATLPFAFTSLLTINWFCFPILYISLLIVPFLKYTVKQKTYFRNISKIIPVSLFEWISGFRKSFMYLIPFYILALCFSWVRIFPLFILWLITLTVISFYYECESLPVLKEGNLSPSKLLSRKLIRHSKYFILLCLPILLINAIFNFDYWFIDILFILVQLSVLCFAICLKYTTYKPNKINTGNNILLSIIAILSIVPFLLPVPFLLALSYYGKAKVNLNSYLK